MRKKFIFIGLFCLLLGSLYLKPSEYDKLMNPAIESKKINPNMTFGDEVEPQFPDEDENNKTIAGVDKNNNGVRDDVEIWINRTAEDQYIRVQLKDYYKKLFAMYEVFSRSNSSDLEKNELETQLREAMTCVSTSLYPYEKMYHLEKVERDRFYVNSLQTLTFNTSHRLELVSKANRYHYRTLREINTHDVGYCSPKVPLEYWEKVKKEYQKK